MADNGFLNELLGIEKLRVTSTEIDGKERITLSVESIEEVASCAECGQLSLQVMDYVKSRSSATCHLVNGAVI